MARVFISSTFEDLTEHRAAAIQALRRLGHEVIAVETATSSSGGPLPWSRAQIAESDLFVGILAWRYGQIPPTETKSLVELEFRFAQEAAKPMLIFVVDEHAPWSTKHVDFEGEAREKVSAFRREVMERHLVQFFSTPEDLAIKLMTAVALWQSGAAGSHSEEPAAPSPPVTLPASVDALDLAFRLVLDRAAEPSLLLQVNLDALAEAVTNWARHHTNPASPGPALYEQAQNELRTKYAHATPNTLWLAWMRATRPQLRAASSSTDGAVGSAAFGRP